ncbi:MAG: hypothetical protein Q4G27_02415 [Flavobacteriaceae bacterium]|nr:hypothetical protein [Flavobacteriaceae bacterium]
MNPHNFEIQSIETPKSNDMVDKMMANNAYFRNKTLVGILAQNILIYHQHGTDLYIVSISTNKKICLKINSDRLYFRK